MLPQGAAVGPSKLSQRPRRPPLEAPETEQVVFPGRPQVRREKTGAAPKVWQHSTCTPEAASSGPAPRLVDATAAQGPAGRKEAGLSLRACTPSARLSQAGPGLMDQHGGGAQGGCSAPLGAQDSPTAGGASQEVRTLWPVLGDCPRCLVLTQDQRGASNKRPPPPVPSLWFWGSL